MFVAPSSRKKFEKPPQPGDIVDCLICRGTGTYATAGEEVCLRCNGTGKAVLVRARCPVCHGSGTVSSSQPCHVCNSAGWICKAH